MTTVKAQVDKFSRFICEKAALQLEIAGREGNPENAEAMFVDIQEEFEKVKSFVSLLNWIQMTKKQADNKEVKRLY